MKRRVLVTGGAGFIGSHLIRLWLREDTAVEIVNLDKLTYCGDLSRLKEAQADRRYRFVEGDVANASDVERALEGCTDVVHLAAETHVDRSLIDARSFFETNLFGTYILLEAVRKAGLRRFLYVSTDEVYGSREKGFFTEKDALHPSSPYSVSKTAGDLLASSYVKTYGVDVVITRGSNTYGPYQYPEKVIPLFVSNALSNTPLPLYGDGHQVRNWIYVEDHARAILHAFKKGKTGEIYNISSVNTVRNVDLTLKLLKILGKPRTLVQKVKDRPGHDRRYAIRSDKLRRLGWKERFPFEKTFAETVLWYRDHADWWKAIKEKKKDFQEYYAKAYGDKVKG